MRSRLIPALLGVAASLTVAVPMMAAGYGSGPIGSAVLLRGDRGPAVRTLQGDLDQFGANLAADGIYGPLTQAAVESFQRQHGLAVTGTMDGATFEEILTLGGWSAPWTAGSSGSSPQGPGSVSGSGSSGSGTPSGQVLYVIATAYAPTAKDNYPYGAVNYYGQPLKAGDIAVDPSVIPLGSELYICGYTSPYLPQGCMYGIADDTGGAIKGLHIDIFENASEQQVSNFGIQHVTVTIVKRG